jgi:hypothetical protein
MKQMNKQQFTYIKIVPSQREHFYKNIEKRTNYFGALTREKYQLQNLITNQKKKNRNILQ